jgi:hypothetical protein
MNSCHTGSIPASNDYYRECFDRASGRVPSVIGEPYWDLGEIVKTDGQLHGFDTLAELYEGVISDARNGDISSSLKRKRMRAEATKHNHPDYETPDEDCQVLEFADGSVYDEDGCGDYVYDSLAAWHAEHDDEEEDK